jgi:hypothetical protein
LSGCVGRPLDIECAGFAEYAHPVQLPLLVRQIQSDADITSSALRPSDDALRAFISALPATDRSRLFDAAVVEPHSLTSGCVAQPAPSLLLSGGGQWGAFGAGFLKSIDWTRPCPVPPFLTITGISTGAMQALILGQGHDDRSRNEAAEKLFEVYSKNPREILIQKGPAGVIFKGAMADLRPLKRSIDLALCPEGPAQGCPGIAALADPAAPTVIVGFVEGKTGDLQFVVLNVIARDAVAASGGNEASRRRGQQCLAAATIASSAMPLYYQQVRVGGPGKAAMVTYYDGGARTSVLEPLAAAVSSPRRLRGFLRSLPQSDPLNLELPTALQARLQVLALSDAGQSPTLATMATTSGGRDLVAPTPPALYVVRNGPTTVQLSGADDEPTNAITAAERAYKILVNQTEISSIALLREIHPEGRIYLATAGGFDNINFARTASSGRKETFGDFFSGFNPDCIREGKRAKAMFDKQFMTCLRHLGAFKAGNHAHHGGPWLNLPELPDHNRVAGSNAPAPAAASSKGTE